MGDLRARPGRDRSRLTGIDAPVLALALLVVVLLGLATGSWGLGGGLGERRILLSLNAVTRLGSALFVSCGVLLLAFSSQHRNVVAARLGVASMVIGAADGLAILARGLDPRHATSLGGGLATTTVALVCVALLAPAVTAPASRPLRGQRTAAVIAVLIGLFAAHTAVQLLRPGTLDGGPVEQAVLDLVSAATWSAFGGLVLLHPGPKLSAGGRTCLAQVSGLLAAGHLLTAADGVSPDLFTMLAVVARLSVAALLLRATWRALEERFRTASHSQDRLSAALVEAVDATQEQERTRAQLTHDARNACAGVRASLEILSDHGEELDSETRQRLRQVAMFGVMHLEQVISGADPYARDFAVMEVVHGVVGGRRVLGDTVAVMGDDLWAYGRPHVLATVLLNLLVNAERHATGTQVTVDVAMRGGQVRVCVADSGPGISPEHREAVFAPGWRGAHSTGQGLGLHTARELLRGQGDDLALAPSAQGAAFAISLRVADCGSTPMTSRAPGLDKHWSVLADR